MITLSDGHITVREFDLKDKKKLAELCNNRRVWDNLRDLIPFPYSEGDAENFIRSSLHQNPPLNFAIDYKSEFSGVIGLVKQSDVYRLSAEIGYWIGEPYWGKGIATSAVKLVLNYGFSKLRLERIFASVFDYNIISQKVLIKAGFKQEGISRCSVLKNDSLHDEIHFGIVRNDFYSN